MLGLFAWLAGGVWLVGAMLLGRLSWGTYLASTVTMALGAAGILLR